jgi:predicted acyl esterase
METYNTKRSNEMKKKTFLTIMTCILMIMMISGLKAQDNKHRRKYNPNIDSYQFHQLPPSPVGQMNPQFNVIRQDFNLTLRDNVILECSKFYPDVSNPFLPNGYPGVIMCHGYGGSKADLLNNAQSQASFGYSVYIYSMRGQGNSGGLSNLISLTEAQDLIEFVNYVKHDHSVSGVDSSNVVIMGGSQGGTIPYMAACNGMNVRCIISALASPNFATSWIENGCIKTTLMWSLEYDTTTVRYNSLTTAMLNWIYSSAPDKWDSLAYWMPMNRNFANLVPQNSIPIMMENSWQDYFFNAYGNISTIPILTSPKRYYFGAVVGHGGDTSGTENLWHMNFFNEWFFYWLFNINNGILTRPLYQYASTSFPVNTVSMWSFIHDSSSVWPPAGLTNLNLYFNPYGQLKTTANRNTTNNVVLNNKVTGGLTMQNCDYDAFTGTDFTSRFTKTQIIFTSPTLANKTRMTGTPTMNIDYSSNMDRSQFNFQIYELQGSVQKLVTRVNYTDRFNTSHNVRKTTLVNGNSHSHIFQKGNKIRIILTNLDTSPNDTTFMTTNPYVLPVLDNGSSKLFLSNNSYVTLPLQIMSMSPASNFFVDDENPEALQTSNSVPVTFNLNQNYPNPFNPTTKIEYSIAKSGLVTLKIYDITGREVADLVNAQVEAGIYSVNFNADSYHLSSGVYFYKLNAPEFSQVKEMVLLK